MKRLRQLHCPAAWPPLWLVMTMVMVYGLLHAGFWLIFRNLNVNLGFRLDLQASKPAATAIISAMAVFHTLWRIARFHPACNFPYASWLALSPWNPGKALPLGPIHPVWQDLAVIGALSALAHWNAHIDPLVPVEAFGFVYLLGLTILLGVTATWAAFFAMGFLWPTLMLTDEKWLPTTVILVSMSGVLWYGVRKSLQTFPWRRENRLYPGLLTTPKASSIGQIEIRLGSDASEAASSVGWPFANLSPKPEFVSVSAATSFWVSLLTGWWIYCLMKGPESDSVPQLVFVFGVFGAVARAVVYGNGLAPPFTFRSRIFSGQLIVPGFDQIFLTPLTAIAVAAIGAVATGRSASWYVAAHAIFIGLILFILLAGGPTMRNWVLTGQHRFPPRVSRASSRQSFRPV